MPTTKRREKVGEGHRLLLTAEGAHVLGRHQSHIGAKRRPRRWAPTQPHADQAGGHGIEVKDGASDRAWSPSLAGFPPIALDMSLPFLLGRSLWPMGLRRCGPPSTSLPPCLPRFRCAEELPRRHLRRNPISF